jgi:hypothetical protein
LNSQPINIAVSRWDFGSLLAALIIGFASIIGGALTIREPLWIDELHTYWSASGTWSEIADRSRFGNQSPLWFWIESAWLRSFCSEQSTASFSTFVLRLPSLICWFATFFIIGFQVCRLVNDTTKRFVIAGCLSSLLFSDLIAWFYSIEARPYAAVALLVTLAALGALRFELGFINRLMFVIASTLAVYMHYTAIIVVGLMCIVMLVNQFLERRGYVAWIMCAGLILVTCFPAFVDLLNIGQHRTWWSTFAGRYDLATIRLVLPIDGWLCIAIVALYSERWLRNRRRLSDNSFVDSKKAIDSDDWSTALDRYVVVLAITVIACLIVVWFFAWTKVAPLMHTRYLIGCYPLIVLCMGFAFARLSKSAMIVATSIMMCCWTLSQGGPYCIRFGTPIVWQRLENWPEAIQVMSQAQMEDTSIAIAPMLLETQSQERIAVLGSKNLSYAIEAANMQSESPIKLDDVIVLDNSVSSWPETIQKSSEPKVIVLVRSNVSQIESSLNSVFGEQNIKLLFGPTSQRLSVFSIAKE